MYNINPIFNIENNNFFFDSAIYKYFWFNCIFAVSYLSKIKPSNYPLNKEIHFDWIQKKKKKIEEKRKENASSNEKYCDTIMTSSQGSLDRLRCYEKKRKKKKNRVIRKLFSRESTHGPDRLPLTTWETSMKVFVEPNNRDVVIYGRP